MDKHITIVAILNIAFGIIFFMAALFLFVIIAGAGLISGDPRAAIITGIVGTGVAVILLIFSIPNIIVGIGLIKRFSWARILGLVLAVVSLVQIPFGTIFGVYSLWVLLHDETVMLFNDAESHRGV